MLAQVGSHFKPIQIRLRVRRRTAFIALGIIAFLFVVGQILMFEPLQFTAFQGNGIDTSTMSAPAMGGAPAESSGLPVLLGPDGTFTYRVTIQNQSIIPIQVTNIVEPPGVLLGRIEVQAMPDERDPTGAFHAFTLSPFRARVFLITRRFPCSGQLDSERVRYTVLGVPRQDDIRLPIPLSAASASCAQ